MEWKIYSRKALGKGAHEIQISRGADYKLVDEFKTYSDAIDWMEAQIAADEDKRKLDVDMVYLLENWTGGKLNYGTSYNSFSKFIHTFTNKWIYKSGEWEENHYIHNSER